MAKTRHEDNDRFNTLYAEADRAGLAAVENMVAAWFADNIRFARLDPFTTDYIPGEGCGFAWISVDGNSTFARWAKKYKGWERLSARGVGIAVDKFGQSENRKAVYARAFAKI